MVSMVEIVINCMMLMPSTKEGTGLGVIPSTKSWEILEDGLTLVMMVLSGALLRAVYFPWGKVRNHLRMTSPDVTPHLLRASGLAPAPQRWLLAVLHQEFGIMLMWDVL